MSSSQKIAVVTGAGTGVGKAAALALMKAGYTVVLAGRRKDKLDEVVKEGGGNGLAVATDIADPASIEALFKTVRDTYGRLDLLFNNAGMGAPAVPMDSVPTGTPAGICTIDSSESRPFKVSDWTGTPSTGRDVFEAVMPGRCAAPPAPAIRTSRPRPRAEAAYSNSRSGVRCADTTRVS